MEHLKAGLCLPLLLLLTSFFPFVEVPMHHFNLNTTSVLMAMAIMNLILNYVIGVRELLFLYQVKRDSIGTWYTSLSDVSRCLVSRIPDIRKK